MVTLRRSSLKSLRLLALIVIELIRGTPLLTQILFFFYVVAHGIGFQNRLLTGILILSFFSSVYITELIRASIEAIPLPQWESAKAIGLTTFQTYRYIIVPQALRPLLPSLTGQLASLIKDSSLLSIIGISEFTLAAEQVNATTYCTLESFIPLAIGYLILTLPISLGSRLLEKKLRL
jgi:polar amino acid transport system permease protein